MQGRFRTVIEIIHDGPHEELPLFHLMMRGAVRVLEAEAGEPREIAPKPKPRTPRLAAPGEETKAERKRRLNTEHQRTRNRTKRERWEALGLVVMKDGYKTRVDVEASLAKLGLTREALTSMSHPRGSASGILERAIRRSGKPHPTRRAA